MLPQHLMHQLGRVNRDRPVAVSPRSGAKLCVEGPSSRELPAGFEVENAWGKHWQIDQWLDQLWPQHERHIQRRVGGLAETCHADVVSLHAAFPDKVFFLDLETCGFAGSIRFHVSHFRPRQYHFRPRQ